MVKVKAPFRSTLVFHDAYTPDPLTGVKSTYPIYFLRIAGDPAAQVHDWIQHRESMVQTAYLNLRNHDSTSTVPGSQKSDIF